MKETELKIHIYGDKILRKKSLPVKIVGTQEKELLEKMASTMYSVGGIGLAAPQIGIDKQIAIVDVGQGLFKLINPKIKIKQGLVVMEEGCLSLPEVSINVKRAKKIFVECLDEFNKKICFWDDDLFSRVIQHEVDNLRGRLIVDYANFFKKIEIKKKFKAKNRGKK